jgi:hypothetical protein
MRISILIVAAVIATGAVQAPLARQANASAPDEPPLKIVGVIDSAGNLNPAVALGQKLRVKLSGTAELDPTAYVLFLGGRPIAGLDDTIFDSSAHALVFDLRRNDTNSSAWKGLLGSPGRLTVPVTVALGTKEAQGSLVPNIIGDGTTDKFDLALAPKWRLLLAGAAITIVATAVWVGARRTTLLKDNLLTQIAPSQQPYSLGRWQMAFWFTLIFASFVMLYGLLLDFHTITTQALWLMGISGATGISAIVVDIMKDTPADAANRGLQALGLQRYADVCQVRQEIADRQRQLKGNPAADAVKKLGLEIRDRELLLRAYDEAIKPFVSGGWYRDLTTDLNGGALHRLQVFFWTWALGVVFVIGVYTDLAMPQFDTSLLLLMGISSAGYIGFKYPELQQ